MPKTLAQIQDEFDELQARSPNPDVSLQDYAKSMDEMDGSPERQAAYDPRWYNKLNALVEHGFNATGTPEIGGELGKFLGGSIDKTFGTHVESTLEGVGRETPRMVTESMLTLPETASVVGAPVAAGTWAKNLNRLREIYNAARPVPQVLGYGDAALRGYNETDSPLGAVISAGSMHGANKLLLPKEMGGMNVGGNARGAFEKAIDTATPRVAGTALDGTASATNTAQKLLGPLVGFGTDVGATTALNEATRQAQMSVGPNAVGPLDPARNPLTQENIAGNVAGAAFFAPQLYHGLKNPTRISPLHAEERLGELDARGRAEQKILDESADAPTLREIQDGLPGLNPEQQRLQEAGFGVITNSLESAKIHRSMGNEALAVEAEERAALTLNKLGSRDYGPLSPEVLEKTEQVVDETARMSTDARPEWLMKFTDEVKGIIDTMNEGRVNYLEEAARKKEELRPAEFAKWEADQKKNIGSSWHPGARDPAVLDRVWSNGKLQPLTPEWLQAEFNATVDQGGNPQFATRVVAQKVANYMSDRLPGAVEADAASRKAVTETSKNVQKVDVLDTEFIKAVNQLPSQFQRAVLNRTLEIKQHSNFTPSQAEAMGVSEGVRFDKRAGQQKTPYPTWQKAVIDAVYGEPTYGPGGERTNFTRLIQKDANGNYVWKPSETTLAKGAGGKGTLRGVTEGNIEAIATKPGQEAAGAFDEEAAKADLAEGGTGEFLGRTASDALKPGEDVVPADQKLGIVDEKTLGRERDVSAEVAKKGDLIKKNMASLTDDQLWSLARDQFRTGHGADEGAKKAGIRAALTSVLEGRFRDARVYFQFKRPTEGARVNTQASGYHVDRAAKVLAKLADMKAVERARTNIRAQADEGQKPQTGVDVAPGSPGTLENPPKPGEFAVDAARTLKARIHDLLGREGYSGSTRDFLTEVAVALSRQMDMSGVDFYRLQGHPEGMVTGPLDATNGRANLGINVDKAVEKGTGRAAVTKLLQTLQHEITHMDGYIKDGLLAKPDAYSDERKRVFDNMMHLMTNLNEDERAAMLQMVREYVPVEMQEALRQADGRPYGTSNPEEAVAQLTGHVVNMLMFDTPRGRSAAMEMLDYAPQEFREFARNTFKTVVDIMQSMKDAVEEPNIRADEGKVAMTSEKTDSFILTKGFDALLDSARVMTELRYVDHAMADARTFMAQVDGSPNPGMTNAMWHTKSTTPFKAQETMPERPSETSLKAFKYAADYIGPRVAANGKKENLVMSLLAPFRNRLWAFEKEGNPIARSLGDTIFGLEGGTNRVVADILSPYMKVNTDGSMNYSQLAPLIQRIQKEPTGRWRDDGINKISAWQQDNQRQPMFVLDPKTNTLIVNPGVKSAQTTWDRIRTQFSRADQDFIMSQSHVLDLVGQRMADHQLTAYQDANVNRLTAVVQAKNRQMPTQQAWQLARGIHDAFLSGNVLSLEGTIPPDQLAAYQRLLVGEDGKGGLLGDYNQVKTNLQSSTGWRSESLPHDWLVRYRNKDNEVKFDSRAELSQAQALAKTLVAQGNRLDGEIVNRRDINKFSVVDDPTSVLIKASERAGFVWEKFVGDMRKQFGDEFANALQSGYTPLESTLKDQSSEGAAKMLKERKGYVDREKFDYVDSTLATARRLGRAIAVRHTVQTVANLLNDPSIRTNVPFKNEITGHLTEMLRPQGETMKELKGIVSGMSLAGNLSSVVTNAMQSLQTLVPILDAKNPSGGMVKPWKQLMSAAGKTIDMVLSDSWTKDAARAATKDPTTWTEAETVAALWKKQNEIGGFTHTVADDLTFGGDQRLLDNSKFGRGDYGPVTKTSMVRSGLYRLNQFGMLPFRKVERMNARVAFVAGVKQAYEKGMRGDAAFSEANQVQGLATFGGGRANTGGLHDALSRGFTPGGAGLALALQQYAFGVVAMHAQFVKDAIGNSTMSPSEKFHARRVYGSMLMTQVALAGTLGLPLVGATLTALEKVFGIPANQAVRNGLAGLSVDEEGNPDETGQAIAEIGLNGFLDYYTGLDASSRLGTTSLLGTSSYRGFNWGDLTGPAGGILENGIKSLGYFAHGEPLQAASALAPQALKNAILQTDMQHKYGDSGFRDTAGNLIYTPTPTESRLYNFGVRPVGLSRRRQAATAIQTSDDITTAAADRELDGASRALLEGDGSQAMKMAMGRMQSDPTQNYRDVLRQVMDRAVGSQVEKDLLATGSKLNESERSHIVKTFGADVNNRRSEVDLQKLRMQMATLLGDPSVAPNESSFKQAAMVDALVQGQGMPRSQAVRLVQFLHLD